MFREIPRPGVFQRSRREADIGVGTALVLLLLEAAVLGEVRCAIERG